MITSFTDLKSEEPKKYKSPEIPWAHQVLRSQKPRGDTVSPLLLWWEGERKKKLAGEANEIDINKILAAAKGTKNDWSEKLTLHPEVFKKLISNEKYDWEEIRKLK